jgi:Zn-dependent protease with chaperone function
MIGLPCLVLLAHGQGKIVESRDWLVGAKQHKTLDYLKTHLGFPNTELKDQVVVKVDQGAAFYEVLIVGPVAGDARKYAAMLNQWQSEFGGHSDVEYSQENDCAAARLQGDKGRFGQIASTTELPIPSLVVGLRQLQLKSNVVIRVPKYAVGLSGQAPDLVTSNYRYYQLREGQAFHQVSVLASLPPWTPLLFWAFTAFVPVAGFLSLGSAYLIGRNERVSLERRRVIYSRLARFATFGSMTIHFPFAMYMMLSGNLRPIADLWFGAASILGPIIPFLFAPIILVVPFSFLSPIVEKSLFGRQPGDPSVEATQDPPKKFGFKDIGKGLTTIDYVSAGITISGFVLMFGSIAFIPSKSPLSNPLWATGMVMTFSKSILSLFVKPKPQVPEAADGLVFERFRVLSQRIGTPEAKLEIDRGLGANKFSATALTGDRIKISQAAAERLPEPELDFILAHELAHLKLNHLEIRGFITYGILAAILFPFFFIVLQNQKNPSVNTMFIIAIPALLFFVLRSLAPTFWRRQEYQADRLALETTRDPDAAERALRAVQFSSELPHLHDQDLSQTHPAMHRRINAIHQTAVELGIWPSVVEPSSR